MLKIYYKFINFFSDKTFSFWQMLGFHLTPVHFYQPIPDTRKLKNNVWEKEYLSGISFNEEDHLNLLSLFVRNFKDEYEIFFKENFNINNHQFESVDAEVLYCMVRHAKPKKIIEVGSGYSTLIIMEAIKKNIEEGFACNLASIDPYPKDFLRKNIPDFFQIIRKEVQKVNLKEFLDLAENDMLFIDSSHVLKIGSDIQYEFLEILPNLNKGVLVHIHDIFLPREYPKEWVLKNHRFFNEQYILQAFLAFNEKFRILFAANFITQKFPGIISQSFNSYNNKVNPGSFWIRKIM